jgi:membrane protease YdiL (CAAX protease family)
MESSRELSRKAFVAAVLFESSLAGAALVLGSVTEVAVFATFAFDAVDAGIGVLATLPPLAFLFVFVKTDFAPLVPVFRACTWDELLALALVAGVGEELLFRGWMQEWLTPTAGPWAALAVTSIAFGLVHAVTPAYAVLAMGIGLYLGGLQMWTGNLLAPIVVHALYDFVAFLVLLRRAPPQS